MDGVSDKQSSAECCGVVVVVSVEDRREMRRQAKKEKALLTSPKQGFRYFKEGVTPTSADTK